jgi:hypothetical protein
MLRVRVPPKEAVELILDHGHAPFVSSHSPRPWVAWQASDEHRKWGTDGHDARLSRRHANGMDEASVAMEHSWGGPV